MNKLQLIALTMCLAVTTARGTDIAISALPAASSINAADVGPIVQSGTTKKATFTVQKSYWDTFYQSLDGDLTALSALTGTHTIYYRSAASTWSPVTIGNGLNFTGATLAANTPTPTPTATPTATATPTPTPTPTATPYNNFGTVAVSGQSDVVADAPSDTVNIAAGSNVTITTNATTDTVTIAASGGSISPLTTKGDLWGFTTVDARVPVGANGKFLIADSAQSEGIGYSTRDLDAATHKINNVTDPSSAQDAATKNYVDSLTLGGTGLSDAVIPAYRALGSTILAQTVGLTIYDASGGTALVDQRCYFVAVYLPSAQTVTGVKWLQTIQGSYTADNNNKVGLYSYSGGTLTLVASSTNDGNLWKAASATVANKAFSSTYPAAAGIYYVGFLYNNSAQTTGPAIANAADQISTANNAVDFTNSAALMGILAAQSDLPSPQAISGLTKTSQAYFWVALY